MHMYMYITYSVVMMVEYIATWGFLGQKLESVLELPPL